MTKPFSPSELVARVKAHMAGTGDLPILMTMELTEVLR
jgi:DNA-binding response OmpR family regulator